MKRTACRILLAIAIAAAAIIGGCKNKSAPVKSDATAGAPAATAAVSSAYDYEADWNDASKLIPLGYQEAQGRRIFYQYCVWCHADATPAGPSNRSNLTPVPPLLNDGDKLNKDTDEFLAKYHRAWRERREAFSNDASVRQDAHCGSDQGGGGIHQVGCSAALSEQAGCRGDDINGKVRKDRPWDTRSGTR